MMMGVCPPWRSRPQRSKPFVFGSMRSSTTRSGANTRAWLNAVSPSVAHCTSKPSNVRLSPRTRASEVSSSTMRIRFFIVPRDRNDDADRGADVQRAPDGKPPAMVAHDALHDGQAQSSAVRDQVSSAKEFAGDVIDLILGDAAALIADIQHDVAVFTVRRNMEMACDRRIANGIVHQVVQKQSHGGPVGPYQR